MSDRREYIRLNLTDAIENQAKNYSTIPCFDCGGIQQLTRKPKAFIGITVWDFPTYHCSECDTTSHQAATGIAVEDLKDKHNLHGGYNLQELLRIEAGIDD